MEDGKWKIVTPGYKGKGSHSFLRNFRPISVRVNNIRKLYLETVDEIS